MGKSPSPAPPITASTPLQQLNNDDGVPIKTAPALMTDPIYGRLTADALALAYPRDGDASPTCFVKPDPQWSAPAPPKQPKRAKQPKADRVTSAR